MQTGLKLTAAAQQRDLGDGCLVALYDALRPQEAADLQTTLTAELPWVQEVYYRGPGGRAVAAPRLTSFHADPDCAYSYSGLTYRPQPWTPTLGRLRDLVTSLTGQHCNSVLCNLYRDGRDAMGYHADNEPELGPRRDDIFIASLSLGAPRRFILKHRSGSPRHRYELGDGRLLVMRGATQQRYLHALPRTKRPVGPRLNLTFRVIVPLPHLSKS